MNNNKTSIIFIDASVANSETLLNYNVSKAEAVILNAPTINLPATNRTCGEIDGNLDSDRDGQATFNINSTTGQITANHSDNLDFESNSNFQLQITVSDGINISSVETVTINLLDIDANTLSGTPLAHQLTPSLADDIIYGYKGSDRLYGETGRDTIYSGAANDRLDAGDTNDYLYSQDGNDRLMGGADNDTLAGGTGDDFLDYLNESGNVNFTFTDTQLIGLDSDILSSLEQVTLTDGISDNILDTSPFSIGSVYLDNCVGNDYLLGQDDSDRLYSNAGNDYVYRNNRNDYLYG